MESQLGEKENLGFGKRRISNCSGLKVERRGIWGEKDVVLGNGALEGEKSRWRDSDLFEKIETKVFVDRDKQATVKRSWKCEGEVFLARCIYFPGFS